MRDDGQRLIRERNLKEEVERRAIQIGRTLDSTRTTLNISNRQRAQLQVQHNECFQSLASTQAQVRRLNSEEVASIAHVA